MSNSTLLRQAAEEIRRLTKHAQDLEGKVATFEKRAEVENFIFGLIEQDKIPPVESRAQIDKMASQLMDCDLAMIKRAMEFSGNLLELGSGVDGIKRGNSQGSKADAAEQKFLRFLTTGNVA